MMFELFTLIAAGIARPDPGMKPEAPPTTVSSMAADRKLNAVVKVELTPGLEDLAQPAIFRSEGRNRAITVPSSAAPVI